MPSLLEVFAVLFLSGVISSGVTEIVKIGFKNLRAKWKDDKGKDPAAWQITFRIVPLVLGTFIGREFYNDAWGYAIGASGGLLSTVLYSKAKQIVLNLKSPKV
jgi:hypothetical protein